MTINHWEKIIWSLELIFKVYQTNVRQYTEHLITDDSTHDALNLKLIKEPLFVSVAEIVKLQIHEIFAQLCLFTLVEVVF